MYNVLMGKTGLETVNAVIKQKNGDKDYLFC